VILPSQGRTIAALNATSTPRLAELVGSLSIATDLAAGFGIETALRTCLIAVELGRAADVAGEALRDVYYTGLLRFIGCTAFAAEQAFYGGGDDLAYSHDLAPIDAGSPADVVGTIVRKVGRGAGAFGRVRAVARTLTDPSGPKSFATAHCDLAVSLASRLGMSASVVASLGQMYERWDGKGYPNHVKGDGIALPARLMQVAWRAEVHRALDGPVTAIETVHRRAGGELDPRLAALFVDHARHLLAPLAEPSVWDAFLAAEPRPHSLLARERVGDVAEAFAQFVDIKSPYTLGHSTGVARLAHAAAERAGLPDAEELRIAALLHDLGRVSVPNGIWDKPSALNPAEWERVRMHAYQTERILSQSPLLVPYARIAGHHHERGDGSGYHRGVAPPTRPARFLAAADVYHAMTEERAHRPARTRAAAAEALMEDARRGRLDREAVDAVLAAAGHDAPRVGRVWPAALSDREVEVMCLLARGLANKEIAQRLAISPKTVQHHVAHIYEKTNVRTRASAALFAVENHLLE
jgi:HD-GYP domain-containing protein (c-di-GMP phosphodiesterase class II)/DNA-binding CsgD family transcriptional regulator